MSFDAAEYRRILGHWATGVAVVTTRVRDEPPVGLTANAVTSLSLDPPLVLVCIDRTSDSHDPIRAAGVFAVNILRAGNERTARRFADADAAGRFEGLAWRAAHTGAPILEDALAWVDCRISAVHAGGDHTIFVGRVVAGDADDGAPLLFYRGGYADLTP